MVPAIPPWKLSRNCDTLSPETVTPSHPPNSIGKALPQDRRSLSGGRSALSGLDIQWLYRATKTRQSATRPGLVDGVSTQSPATAQLAGSRAAVPESLPGITTAAEVTAVEASAPDRTPETSTVSSPSEVVSGFTVKLKVVVPVEAPAAMEMAAGEVAVKSAEAPSVAVPPATDTVTVVPPAGATTPSGRVAVTVIVSVLSAASSSTTAGLTPRTAEAAGSESLPTMTTAAEVTAVEASAPDRTPETTTVSSPSCAESGFTVKSKVVVPAEAPSAMEMAAGEVAVKSAEAPSVAVPPATDTVTVVPPAGATTPSGREAVTVIVSVLSASPSLIVDGLTRNAAPVVTGASVMVSCTGLTASPVPRPETVTVSEPSSSSSASTTKV